ncbi:MAG: 4-hydroxy-tetrahydrodipicolinate reductase [Porphyromonadaceae bacterium]|nr:4-hydroxy-tetrahydrodipicolinate reductase [Porphyromonadaceae bacterium]
MKLALIGFGKMGHIIEEVARSRGHEIVSIIDVENPEEFESESFRKADAAIEFTTPSAALENYRKAFAANVPVVSGTTGWTEHLPEIQEACQKKGKTFFYASNFSLGVNLFFALNRYLAHIMNSFPLYEVKIEETHHIHKLDAPSGTAISLANDIIENLDRKTSWVEGREPATEEIGIKAIRRDEVPGCHSIIYESDVDTITLTHDAKNRKGFALGAVVAAEFIYGKKGFFTMQDMLKL